MSAGPGERASDGGDRGLAGLSVVVLAGGTSGERAVSLDSGRAILAALEAAGEARPDALELLEIDAEGLWVLPSGRLPAASALARLQGVDLFFLALHGGRGENGTVQGLLELSGCAYTGSGVGASALCMDKLAVRALAPELGVRVARGRSIDRQAWLEERPALDRELEGWGSAWVVKPRCGGSSVATRVAHSTPELGEAVESILEAGDEALVEERVAGPEGTCAILGNRGEALEALPVVEIRPKDGRFFDYEEKYSEGGALELCPPETLAPEACRRAQEVAGALHRMTGCDGYSRTDFVFAQESGEPVLLEINTLPGMTPRSLLPRAAGVAGLDMTALCVRLARAGLDACGRRAGGGEL